MSYLMSQPLFSQDTYTNPHSVNLLLIIPKD